MSTPVNDEGQWLADLFVCVCAMSGCIAQTFLKLILKKSSFVPGIVPVLDAEEKKKTF